MLPEHPNDNSLASISSELGNALQGFEARQNLTGVFSLLLTVDKRLNPQTYSIQPTTNEYA